MPQCDPSDTRLTSQADCPPGSGCYSREACGSTVWCASGPAVDPIWPPTATKLVAVNEGGGFVANPPPGSPCAIDGAKFTFTPSTRHLAWELCNSTATPYAIVKGQRTITVGEAGTIDAAMSKLVIVNTNTCGADKPSLWVSVTTPSATAKYLDSFYACNKQGSYVDEIDGVFSVLRPLAK